jgi:RNA polymerase sigma-70 factor, ECF subfamily
MTEAETGSPAAAPAAAEGARAAAEAAARASYGKLVAYLCYRSRDVAAAEDALADAFAAALATWPSTGVPRDPEAWLLTAARRRWLDQHRRHRTRQSAEGHLRMLGEEAQEAMQRDDPIQDRRLTLLFACAHPAIEPSVRAPLMLQTILGLDAAQIAGAFLLSPAAMAQRLVRAKARLKLAGIPFAVPEREQLAERLPPVLSAIYAAFSEGWTDPSGGDARRGGMAGEGLWLGRLLASLMPQEPEVLGLLALMLYADSRRLARRGADGAYIPLAEQDVELWDRTLLAEADAVLRRAGALGRPGRYQIEAAVQAAHAARRDGGAADWASIVRFYRALAQTTGSPVASVNLAAALAETDDPAAGLAVLEAVAGDPRLADYQPYFAARAALLDRLGRTAEAATCYDRAIGLERDPAVRGFLQARRDRSRGRPS